MTEATAKGGFFKALTFSIPVLMGLFIFLNPFPYTTAIKEICFYGSAFIILILVISRQIELSLSSPLTLPIFLFVVWASFGLFFAVDKENSIHDFQVHLLKYVIFYYIMINYFNSREWLLRLSWIILVSAALFSVGEIVYFYILGSKPLSTKFVTGIPEIAVNGVGIIAVPAIIFGLHNLMTQDRLPVRIVSLILVLPTTIMCFLTQARGTILAMLLSFTILFFKNKRILLICIGVALLFASVTPIRDRFINSDPSNKLRLGTYFINYEIIKDYPILGIGFGMETYGNRQFIDLEAYNRRIPEHYRGSILKDPHSMLFSIAVRTGLIGLGLFLSILVVPFRMLWRNMRKGKGDQGDDWGRCLISAWVAVLVIGFFEPFFSHFPEIVFYTLLAMMTIAWKTDQNRSVSHQT